MKIAKTNKTSSSQSKSNKPFFQKRNNGDNEPFFKPSITQNQRQNLIQREMNDNYPWDGFIDTQWSAALRGAPSRTKFLANLPKGTPVKVTGNTNNWLYLKAYLNGKELTGYVSQELVTSDKEKGQDKTKFDTYPKVKESSGWLFSREGTQIATATNLIELGMASIGNAEIVYLKGSLLEQIKKDPDMIAKENIILSKIKNDERYLKQPFYITGRLLVGFGGQRWTSSDEEWSSFGDKNPLAHGETWDVAGNELTWALRNATVKYWADIDLNGGIEIKFHLNDTLDLSGSKGRSEAYNNISNSLGFLYHDLAGGNINLQTRAEWTSKH